ncbi:unnamed protein product [Closterium sp. NIES-54]
MSICTCTQTGRHLATFTRWPGSSLYTLPTKPPQVAASAQVSASGQVAPLLVSPPDAPDPFVAPPPGSPLPATPLWHALSPPCLWSSQRTAPHSSSFPPAIAPLQTLHMDVWGPARVSGQGRKRYFLLVVDDYMQYTTVFPLHSKVQFVDVLIPWIHAVCLQLRERFSTDLPVLRLHSDRGGQFSSDLLRDFCRGEGILHSFTLLESPQQNEIAERRIGLFMEVARTSMIHAAAPHFLWLFAVRYAAHQLNLWPRVSLLETSPILCWTGKVGDVSVFRAWGSRAFVRDTSADKLSARAIPCGHAPSGVSQVDPLLGIAPVEAAVGSGAAPGAMSNGVASGGAEPGGVDPWGAESEGAGSGGAESRGPPLVDPLPPQGHAPSGVSQVDPLLGIAPVEAAVGSGAAPGAMSNGVASGGAEPGGVDPWGAESEGAGSGGAESRGAQSEGAGSEGAEPWGAEPGGAEPTGVEPGGTPLSPHQLREWFAQRTRLQSGAAGAGDSAAGDTRAGGAGVTAGAGGTGGAAAAGPGGSHTGGTGAAGTGGVGGAVAGDPTEPGAAGAGVAGAVGAGAGGTGAGGAGAGGAGAVDPGAGGAGGAVRP